MGASNETQGIETKLDKEIVFGSIEDDLNFANYVLANKEKSVAFSKPREN